MTAEYDNLQDVPCPFCGQKIAGWLGSLYFGTAAYVTCQGGHEFKVKTPWQRGEKFRVAMDSGVVVGH